MHRANRQRQDNHIDNDLARPRRHPKIIIVEAVSRIRQPIQPTPLQRPTVRQRRDRAADPPAQHERARNDQLPAEGAVHGEQAQVHGEDGEFGAAGDGEVQHGGDEGQLEVEDVGGRVDVVWVRVVGDGFAVGVDGVACFEKSVGRID